MCTTLSGAPLTLCRQCPFTFPGRSAEPWRACASSTLQVIVIVKHAVTVLQACAHFAFAALLKGLTPCHGDA